MPSHLYVHVPFCQSKCSYCAFHSTVEPPPSSYVGDIAAEIGQHAPDGLALQTLYVGGGTPTTLGVEGLAQLCATLTSARQRGSAMPAEWTVEANPGTLSPDMARTLRAAGVTRISIGAQSFDPATLAQLGRRHDAAAVASAVAAVRDAGFADLGLDLIAGVPGLSAAAWHQTLSAAVALEPDHLSVYALSVEPGTPLARAIEDRRFRSPDDDEQMEALEVAEDHLAAYGYRRYEISNYAREGHACRHNLAVWRGEDYLGVGPAAASRWGLHRWTNAPDTAAWRTALAAGRRPPREEDDTLTPEQDAAERFLTGLRLSEGAAPNCATRQGRRWAEQLDRLVPLGIVESAAPGRWRLTRRGREVVDAVVCELAP